ncbi:BMC domain-containing protein [Clostridium sp. Mt-5]|uniref:BMC domain-containing protein n=1 Tax=Clostridium moutaii TaxID=3240932 RepID=A0ABV4BTN4_9CLOT
MQALGLIETKGLVAAIESADAMLKAADVNILEKMYVGGGLVSIAVTGDVAAVKAAVEAGAAAVGMLNSTLLISQHVIPRPHEYLEDTIISSKLLKDMDIPTAASAEIESAAEIIKEETAEAPAKVIEEEAVKVPSEVVKEETAEAPVEVIKEQAFQAEDAAVESFENDEVVLSGDTTPSLEMDLSKLHNRKDVDKILSECGLENTIKLLSKLKVIELRNLARKYRNFGIKGRSISKAGKQLLITEFKKFYGYN